MSQDYFGAKLAFNKKTKVSFRFPCFQIRVAAVHLATEGPRTASSLKTPLDPKKSKNVSRLLARYRPRRCRLARQFIEISFLLKLYYYWYTGFSDL